jgi:hypothetical protein
MLAARAGLEDVAASVRAGFGAVLAANAGAAWRALEETGVLHPDAAPPELELPWAFEETLATAIAVEEREASGRAPLLRQHYLELMPRRHVEQLATVREPNATLLHTRLVPERLPRLAGALERLYRLVAGAGVEPAQALPAPTVAELFAQFPTVARLYGATCYGGFMPLLYGTPADLARAARTLDGNDVQMAIDRHLTAPIVHELTHFGRRRKALLPLYLDECVAGFLGVHIHPAFAFPRADEADGLYGTPWFAQVGQALARVVGLAPLVRAHTGAVPWADVLPVGFAEAALARGWQEYLERRGPHFLSDSFHPEPWRALIGEPETVDDDSDERALADALRAMCLENVVEDGAYVVRARPPAGPVQIDVARRRVTTALRSGSADHAAPAYALPAAIARRLEASGITALSINLTDLEGIPALAGVLRRGELAQLGQSRMSPWRASFS